MLDNSGFTIGPAHSVHAVKVLLLGSGELGKEVAIELQRLGCEVIACDRYEHAPAMQVAHRSHIFNMLDGDRLREVIDLEQPDLVVPEIEAIATATLLELEQAGQRVVPTARAAKLTMDREGIRVLAAEELGLATSPYAFVDDLTAAEQAAERIGYPLVMKPVMSSSGKGQSVVKQPSDLAPAWQYAQEGGRAGQGRCIIEGFVDFDYEITMLTVSAVDGIQCCPPVGHIQRSGDYRQSWQPAAMSPEALVAAEQLAKAVVQELGGYGLFGVECFVRGDEVLFSEVSPRPHDTGLVTLATQSLSECALHARAMLGLPIGELGTQVQWQPGASVAVLGEHDHSDTQAAIPVLQGLPQALTVPTSQVRFFGKPVCQGERRLAVALATGENIDQALERAQQCADQLSFRMVPIDRADS